MVGDLVAHLVFEICGLEVFLDESEEMGHHFRCCRNNRFLSSAKLCVTEIPYRMNGEGRFTGFAPMSGKKDSYLWSDVELFLDFGIDVLMSYFLVWDGHHHQ